MHHSIRHLLLAAILVLGAACALAADIGPKTEAQPSSAERMARGRDAIVKKDWPKAIAEFNATVKAEPRNADAHNLLAYSYRKQATPDLAQAFDHYKTALTINPKHKGAHEYIGEAYLADKKPAEAERHLAELEKICGNKACEEYGDLAKSIADYKAKN